MDYLEAKVEKFEKEQKFVDFEKEKMQKSFDQLNEKLKLLKGDRDDQVKQVKKLKTRNDDLKQTVTDLKHINSQMKHHMENNQQSSAGFTNPSQPSTNTVATKQKFNSIDVGFDEVNFNNNNQKNSRTNVN